MIVSAANATTSLAAAVYPATLSVALTPPANDGGISGPSVFVPVGLLSPPIITLLIQNAAASASTADFSTRFYAVAAYASANALNPGSFATVAAANVAQAAQGQVGYFGAIGAATRTETPSTPATRENTLAAATLNPPESVFAALEQGVPSESAP